MVGRMEIYIEGGYLKTDDEVRMAVGAAVFKHESGSHSAYTRLHPPTPPATKQRAELMAMILALERAVADDNRFYTKRELDVNIYSSSEYAVKCVMEWPERWLENMWLEDDEDIVENEDLIRRAIEVENLIVVNGTVKYNWIPKEENAKATLYCAHVLGCWLTGYPMEWEWEWVNGRRMEI